MEELLKQIEQQVISKVKGINIATLTDIELAQLFSEIEFLSANASDIMTGQYANTLNEILEKASKKGLTFAATSENLISQIIELDTAALAGRAAEYSKTIQSRILKGIVGGESVTQIAQGLEGIGLATNQTIALVNTSETQLRQIATAELYKDEPETRFILVGPLDEKTRDSCRNVLQGQPENGWTLEEIENGAASQVAGETYTYLERGGFNCRHDWQAL